MVANVKAWLLQALSALALLISTVAILAVATGGNSGDPGTAADVGTADMLRHLLAGEGERPMPRSDTEPPGTWTVIPAPSDAEKQENLRKALASRTAARGDQSSGGEQ